MGINNIPNKFRNKKRNINNILKIRLYDSKILILSKPKSSQYQFIMKQKKYMSIVLEIYKKCRNTHIQF